VSFLKIVASDKYSISTTLIYRLSGDSLLDTFCVKRHVDIIRFSITE